MGAHRTIPGSACAPREADRLIAGIEAGRDILLITGPAGAGKTWLADQVLASLAEAGLACGRGKYGDDPDAAAFEPIIAALSQALTATLDRQFDPQHGLASLTAALGVQLEVLIGIGLTAPGLSRSSTLRPLADHRQWRGRIVGATVELLRWLDQFGVRATLLIDDWNRAPLAAARLLGALTEAGLTRPPVLVLTGRRDGRVGFLPQNRLARQTIGPRERDEAVALLADSLGDPTAAGLIAERLGDALPRLPFDIHQLALVALEAGWLLRTQGGWRMTAHGSGDLAFAPADRVAALPDAAREAARGLALWGDGAPVDRLALALGGGGPALRALERAGIAVARNGTLSFRHDRLREAARGDADDANMAALAGLMADRLVAAAPVEPAALQLRLIGGLDAADPAHWREPFARGATAARTRGDMAAAARFAEAANTLQSRSPAHDADATRAVLREAMLAAAGRDDPVTEARADALVATARNAAEAFADRELAIVALRFAGLSQAALRIATEGFAAVGIRLPRRTRWWHLLPAMLRWHWSRRFGAASPVIDPALVTSFTGMATAAATTAYQADPKATALIGFKASPLVGRHLQESSYWRGVDAFLFGASRQPHQSAASGRAALASFDEQTAYRGQSLYQAVFFGTLWMDRLADARPLFRRVVSLALEEGDPVMAAYGLRTDTMSGWRCSPRLPDLLEEARAAQRSLAVLGEQSLLDEIVSLVAVLEGLTGERPWSPALWRTDLPARSHVMDLELANLAGDWALTLKLARSFRPLASDYALQSESVLMRFHPMLASLRLGRDVAWADLRALRRAARLNPPDHEARWLLIVAERARIHDRACADHYAAAVAAAEANDSRLLAGLAAESAAAAMRTRGDIPAAEEYERLARRVWTGWGLASQVRGAAVDASEADARAAAAERADAAKTRLIAHVGHELRTPLQALQAQLDLATAGGDPIAAEAVRDVLASLNAVVDDLDLVGEASHRADRIDPAVDLSALIRSELALWTALPATALSVHGSAPPVAIAGGRVRQVVRNLLSNAVKYGGDTRVEVGLAITDDAMPIATITVEDRGPGLPQDRLEALFAPFERGLHDGDGRGTGLGLALSRRIAERLGGSLGAENRPDGGARFVFTFPVRPASDAAPRPVRLGSLDLLLVEDTLLIRRAVAALLRMAGHRVHEVGDAAGASAALARDRFDAVLLDIGLPDGSGLDVLATIRRVQGPLPVLLLTAAVDRALAERIAGDVRTRLLRKPASGATLAAALAELCGTAADEVPPGAPPEYERLKRSARREVRARGIRLACATAPDADAAHQLAGLAAQFGWTDVASAAEALDATESASDRLRAAVAAMD